MSYGSKVLKQLYRIQEEDVLPLLDAKSEVDPLAGIILVKLEIKSVVGDLEQFYGFYAARVLPKTETNPGYVNPHYHSFGFEPYLFFSGIGEMNIGKVIGTEVMWTKSEDVCDGDIVKIGDGEVHSFRNTATKEPANFIFACPATHLCETDRYFTKDLKNGIPPWYPKE